MNVFLDLILLLLLLLSSTDEDNLVIEVSLELPSSVVAAAGVKLLLLLFKVPCEVSPAAS